MSSGFVVDDLCLEFSVYRYDRCRDVSCILYAFNLADDFAGCLVPGGVVAKL